MLADSLINTAWTATPVAGYLTSGVVGVSVVDFTAVSYTHLDVYKRQV